MITPLIRRLLVASAILGLTGVVFFVSNAVLNDNAKALPRPEPEMEGTDDAGWAFKQRGSLQGLIPPAAMENAWRASMQAVAPQSPLPDTPAAPDHWASIGPAPIHEGQIETPTPARAVTGRIVDIVFDPNPALAATHWFIAADTGGIWETTNGGNSWFPRSDGEISLVMSRIAFGPSNSQILFAGTLGFDPRLLKSINGGATWTMLPVHLFGIGAGYSSFSAIKVHPTDPNIVLAMTAQHFNRLDSGVFKSTNGGASFCRTLAGAGTSLEINPANFNQQYAAISYGNDGIYRSLDGGDSWTPLPGPWGSTVATTRIAISPSLPSTIYVVEDFGGIWMTQDAWASTPSWAPIQPPGPSNFTAAYFAVVDPADPSIFYIGGYGHHAFYRVSSNGAWAYIIHTTHLDQHAMAAFVAPGNTMPTLLLGNDGGFWTSDDRGDSWTNKNSNLATVQFYAGAVHPGNATAALGGSQDNGTESWHGEDLWEFRWFGDGAYNAFSYTDPDKYWLIQANGQILKLTVGGGYPQPGGPGVSVGVTRRAPHSNTVLAGSNILWKSTDFFTVTTPTWTDNGLASDGSQVTAIAFAPSDPYSNVYAVGKASGGLWLTVTGGQQPETEAPYPWKNLDPSGAVPGRRVNAIAFQPNDPAIMYVALEGFDEYTLGHPGHVFKTVNATSANPTWLNMSPPANVPMNALAIDSAHPNTIYAGAELGVWKSTNGGAPGSWTFMGPGSGMPNVEVTDLHFSPVDGNLIAFTYGRGAFRLNAEVPETGSLQVTLTPAAAVSAGAQWKLDGGAFQNSGTTLSGITTGTHTVSFKSVNGYATPANQLVQINPNQTTTTAASYSILVPQLANVSTRVNIGTQDNVLIGGFILSGSSVSCPTKQIVLRGLGPSLTGVPGNLADPYIELHRADGSIVAANDNWEEAPNANDIPAFLRPNYASESVILTSLEPGAYTVIVNGVNQTTGIGLFEAYDLEPASSLKLANVSTRGFVQTQDNRMIGGFILSGANSLVVMRGLGPSLPPKLPERLPDPLIELKDANGTTLVTNDNWMNAPNFQEIENRGFRPGDDLESVILTTLPPGAYTVILGDANKETGIGLFEAYHLDF